jgi:hypothetical protein
MVPENPVGAGVGGVTEARYAYERIEPTTSPMIRPAARDLLEILFDIEFSSNQK